MNSGALFNASGRKLARARNIPARTEEASGLRQQLSKPGGCVDGSGLFLCYRANLCIR